MNHLHWLRYDRLVIIMKYSAEFELGASLVVQDINGMQSLQETDWS